MAAKPRYRELADLLRAEIVRGDFQSKCFPTEAELCKRFSVSRFTVREALRALQTDGLIARRRGSGTRIQPAAARGGALHQPLSNVGEILQYARNTPASFSNLGEAPLPRLIAEQLGIFAGGRWTCFHGVRLGIGTTQPIAVTDAYVAEELRDAAAKVTSDEDTIFRQIERHGGVRITEVTQDIQAVPAPSRVSAELGIAKRAPCLRIIRCYRDETGAILEISVSHHPGERFVYSMHIEVDG